jgi:hypothetical protein
MLSQLSTSFEILGRSGMWDAEARTGNPVRCRAITDFKSGYRSSMEGAGYEEASAIEWTQQEVFSMVCGLEKEAGSRLHEALSLRASGRTSDAARAMVQCLLLDRDALAASYLWHSMQRGKECGQLAVEDLHGPDGRPLPFPLPLPVPEGYQVSGAYQSSLSNQLTRRFAGALPMLGHACC